MTTDDKLRMLLHPGEHTVEELDRMLHEEDISVPDVGHEWMVFIGARSKGQGARGRFRLAAACAALLFMSALAVAGVMHLWNVSLALPSAQEETATPRQQGKAYAAAEPSASAAGVESEAADTAVHTFENQELHIILKELAEHYHVEVSYKNEACKHVRFYLQWDNTQTLNDVVEKINHFEKVHLTLDNQTIIAE